MSAPPNARMTLIDIDRAGDAGVFGADVLAAAHEIIARYPVGQSRSALLPMLHLVQSEQGYVSADGIAFCAEVLDLTKAQVAAVATFYTMYKRAPTGEFLVSVCTNTLCGLLGGDEIYSTLTQELGIGMNQTTPDGRITLEHAECLAACDYAPVVTVNYEFFDNQSSDTALALVGQLRAGVTPMPSRGAPLCTFKQISRQIAGFVDARAGSVQATGSGGPTEIGVALAARRGERAPEYPQSQDGASTSTASTAAAEQKAAVNTGAHPGSSANDAPLSTSKSDPDAGAEPADHPDVASSESSNGGE